MRPGRRAGAGPRLHPHPGQGRLENLHARRAVVQADEGLRERELRKWSVLSEAVGRGFRDRGADELTAALAAEMAVTAFRLALTRWLDQDGERGLAEIVADLLGALRSVAQDEPVRRP